MDSKNDDSADSLDKSLQKKCVVDDVGQGEGVAPPESPNTSDDKKPDSAPDEQETSFTFLSEQTPKSVGDGGPIGDDTTASSSPRTTLSGDGSNAFETKVKQISKNLKETTLAESESDTALTSEATDALIAAASSSNSSSSSSSSTSFESETALPSGSSHAESAHHSGDQDSSVLSANESMDDQDQRSKKVRFHPDVKENDGGNRVIPKKKKKLKANSVDDANAAANAHRTGSTDEDMELDEEEDFDDEEEFDLAKTIAEAQDYLKLHPLTFVRPHDKSASLHNGLLEEEDMPPQAESSEDEDFYEQVPPENGVERILGKQVKCGKVEFLLRFATKTGLFWESEDFIWKNCPNMLNSYDHNRERRQERLMRHVAKRQNIRQRYTDF